MRGRGALGGVIHVQQLLLAVGVVALLGGVLEVVVGHLEQQLLQGRHIAVLAAQRLAAAPRVLPHRPEAAGRQMNFCE